MVSVSVLYLCYQPMDEEIKTWPLSFPAKENPNMKKALFDRPIVLQYDVNAKYRLISRKFSGKKFFSPERSLNQPFDNPIKSLYFCSRVLFARFHFKVIRKSLCCRLEKTADSSRRPPLHTDDLSLPGSGTCF